VTRNGNSKELLQAALEYASWGWAVFPLQPRGKRPLPGSRGHNDASTDPRVIRRWWKEVPDANVGIRCCSQNGPIILDLDGPEGRISISDLKLPRTLQATSGRKHRRHFYFRGGLKKEIRRKLKFLPGVDLLGDGGYVVAPPSIHPKTGKPYRWVNGYKAAKLPPSVIRRGKKKPTPTQAPPLPSFIESGARDDLLTSLAGTMRRRGASEEAIYLALSEENRTRCRPPLPSRQVRKIARSISKKPPAQEVELENLTDLGNAKRFVDQHSRDTRCVKIWKHQWVIWDGIQWSVDTTGEAERLAKQTVQNIHLEAQLVTDEKVRETVLKHAIKSEASTRIRAMLEVASTEEGIAATAEVFDRHHWLLNVENGTLNLETGTIREPRREDFLTKTSPVTYDPREKCPNWIKFLRRIMGGDKALVDYIQRCVGYSMTGDTREQCFFFLYGKGQNGKSTFLEVIRSILGPYAQQSDFSTFLQKKFDGGGARNDLARMLGTRFVTAVEASSHRSFDEAVIKQLTGGDAVVARRLYEEHFEFDPTHKIWLAANHRPSIGEQSEAFWRRIRLIPFTVYIPPAKRDRQLKKKLLAESSGILNWMIDGCRKWKAEGLGEPHKVEEAIESYRDSEDLLGEYFEASCRMSPKEWATTADLYRAFTDWWRDTRGIHLKPPSHRWFNRALGERKNLKSIKQNGIPGWKGIGVKVSFQ